MALREFSVAPRWVVTYARNGRPLAESERRLMKYADDAPAALADVRHACAKHGLTAVASKNGRTYTVTAEGYSPLA